MKNPESIYRPLPFWSWNDDLNIKELKRQISWMKENGIGGFFMHARGGLITPYLGDEWFKCVEACVEEANKLGMEAYAYDENGWPSGFAGGKLLENENNRDRYLEYSYGPYDEKAFVSYDCNGEGIIRVKEGENVLNVYKRISNSTVDICNKEVVEQFIEATHENYRKKDKGGLKGFFTDEPQYYRWGHPYSECLEGYFREHYGEDIRDGLGLMFVEKKGYRGFRYRYWMAMNDLMREAFCKQIYDWCDSNGYKFTGHYVEETFLAGEMWCTANIMSDYEYEHIPGVDWLGRGCPDIISSKQVGSVASQLDKKQVLTECFACSGWDVTPLELKRNAEALYWGGVNLLCHHLLPYSEHGQRKRDYPAHYIPLNDWVRKGFKEFNDYFACLGEFLSKSDESPSIALLHPIRSCYFSYKRDGKEPYFGTDDIEIPLQETMKKLTDMHVSWHFLDETLLERHGFVKDGKIGCGRKSYSVLVLPRLSTMGKRTLELIEAFAKQGGRIALPYGLPEYLEGEIYDYSSIIKETVSLDELKQIDGFFSNESPSYRLSLRIDEKGKEYLYVVNVSDEECQVSLRKDGMKSLLSYDLVNDSYTPLPLSFILEKGGSKILYWSEKEVPKKKGSSAINLPKSYKIAAPVENFLTIDSLSFSLDGIHYSKRMFHMDAFSELLRKRYKGKLYLKYSFKADSLPPSLLLEVEDSHLLRLFCNGKEVKKADSHTYEKSLLSYDISKEARIGDNEIIIEMGYFQSEQVYFALFGENVQESLRNCLVYDSNIEPIYLKGEFGVRGNFVKGDGEVLLGSDFALTEQKKEISSIIEDGFPFFHGEITLESQIEVDDTSKTLVVSKRFSLLEIYINGRKVEASMFAYRFDLSEYLKIGINDLKLILSVSPRNCLGPHHAGKGESTFVGPYSFERPSSDTNIYSFVKTII